MTRSISLPVHKTDEFLKFSGAIKRRLELEQIAIEYSAPDLGLQFEANQVEFEQLPEDIFHGEIMLRIENAVTHEQMVTVKLLEEGARKVGFAIEVDAEKCLPERPCFNLQLEPLMDFNGLLGSSFEDRKALPPPSEDSIPVSELFEFGKKEKVFND